MRGLDTSNFMCQKNYVSKERNRSKFIAVTAYPSWNRKRVGRCVF